MPRQDRDMSTLDLISAVQTLRVSRPVFWSEADFQHELAMQLGRARPQDRVRLEWPLAGSGVRAVDILVETSVGHMAIELKYMTQKLACVVEGEEFMLRSQGAQDIRRYDVFKDIARMEELCVRSKGARAAVVVITNDPQYWTNPCSDTNCSAFSLREGRVATGRLEWGERTGPGTKKNREAAVDLAGQYNVAWNDYSDVGGKFGRFRSAVFDIG